MIRKPLAWILVFSLIVMIAPPSAGQSSWTVMVYIDGDNNLESAALDDLNELEDAGSTANVNIVVQIDRIPGFDSSNGDWTTTRRYYVTADPGGYNSTVTSTLLQDLGESNMGDPATLADFVNWARSAYPASNYLLVLWDHGSGWKSATSSARKGALTTFKKDEPIKGVCFDDTNNDYLSMPDLDSALSSMTGGGANPIDILGFDACLMAMVEVSYEVSDYTHYMVGSEEVEPGDGWDYQTTLNWLITNPGSTSEQVASRIVTDYMNFYGFSGFETQSAQEEALVPPLATAVDTLAVDLINNLATYYDEISAARTQAEESPWDPDYIDLYHFAQLIYNEVPNAQIQTDAQNVMNAVSAAVIQEGHGASHPNFHGITIYYPAGGGNYLPQYETDTAFSADTNWNEFLNAYYSTIPQPVHAIVLIDDDNGSNYVDVESFYTEALDALGLPYDYYSVAAHGSPTLSYLQAHSLVIWFTGQDFTNTLSATDENTLIQYLSGGGKLFLSSQDYVWDLKSDGRYPSTFLRNYLHCTAESEDVYANNLTGVAGNEVGDGLGPFDMCWADPATCTLFDYSDWITKDASSEYAFYNERTEYMAITYSASYEMIFCAFPFEAIKSASDRQAVMDEIFNFLGPIPTFKFTTEVFDTNTYFVAGDTAYCTDVLGSSKIAFGLGQGGSSENPEGRTDLILTVTEHDSGNLIIVGGPAVNPLAEEFDQHFGITYQYSENEYFQILADGYSIYLDLTMYPQRDICIVYMGEHNGRTVMLVWGYGWFGTYAGSVLVGDITTWDTYAGFHMLMLRWMDANADGLVQSGEIIVEAAA